MLHRLLQQRLALLVGGGEHVVERAVGVVAPADRGPRLVGAARRNSDRARWRWAPATGSPPPRSPRRWAASAKASRTFARVTAGANGSTRAPAARRSLTARSHAESASAVIWARGRCASTRPSRAPASASSREPVQRRGVERTREGEGIGGIRSRDRGQEQRRVGHVPGQRAVGVEIGPGGDHPGPGHQPEGRLHPDHAGALGRNPVGPAVVGAERGEGHPVGHGHRGARAGPARRPGAGRVVRVLDLAGLAAGPDSRDRRSRPPPSCLTPRRRPRAAEPPRARRGAPGRERSCAHAALEPVVGSPFRS